MPYTLSIPTLFKTFASDNYAGVHPDVMQAMIEANTGDAKAYGEDPWTDKADALFRQHFGEQCAVYYVFNGTGANVLGLQSLLKPHQAIICASTAHIVQDECGAPNRYTGSTTILVDTPDGKLTPDHLTPYLSLAGVQHHVQPKVVSITQSTEYGTLYQLDEIKALADFCHAHGWWLHMDGARLCNAAAALNTPFKAFTTNAGVDVVTVGGTKNGLMLGEAIVFLNPTLANNATDEFKYLRKQAMQLASKMRFISCQFLVLLTDNWGVARATHANAMAQRLARGIQTMAGLNVTQPVQVNAVFVALPKATVESLQAHTPFYVWKDLPDVGLQEVRWMCAYDTTESDVDAFLTLIQQIMQYPSLP
jgi:threonine aldolase